MLFWGNFHRAPSEWGGEEMISSYTLPGTPLNTRTNTFVEYAPPPSRGQGFVDGDAGPV